MCVRTRVSYHSPLVRLNELQKIMKPRMYDAWEFSLSHTMADTGGPFSQQEQAATHHALSAHFTTTTFHAHSSTPTFALDVSVAARRSKRFLHLQFGLYGCADVSSAPQQIYFVFLTINNALKRSRNLNNKAVFNCMTVSF